MTAAQSTFRDVFAVREFRWLWTADMQSLLGDQLARVALSVLVYDRTSSSILTAGTYALTYLPAILGSVVLAPLADRVPRRGLLVTGDLLRAALTVGMAFPQTPLPVVAGLLVVAVAIGTPWKAAESALVSEILADRYVLGVGVRVASVQGAQVVGFAGGGALVAAIGPHGALAIDALTFACSALVLAGGLAGRPRPTGAAASPSGRAMWSQGISLALGPRRLRLLLSLSWLAGVLIVPEGLAAPYAADLKGGALTVGVLLAASPCGLLAGAIVTARYLSLSVRSRLSGPMAVVAGVALIGLWPEPGLPVSVALLAVSGFASAYQVYVMTEFVTALPPWGRGQGIAVASAGLLCAQGVGLAIGGFAAPVWGTGPTMSIAGASAAVMAVAVARALSKPPVPPPIGEQGVTRILPAPARHRPAQPHSTPVRISTPPLRDRPPAIPAMRVRERNGHLKSSARPQMRIPTRINEVGHSNGTMRERVFCA